MSHVLRVCENVLYCFAVPIMLTAQILARLPKSPASHSHVIGGAFHLFCRQHLGDVIRPVTLDRKAEDTPHHGGSFVVDQPVVFVLRVFLIAVDGIVGRGLSGLALHLIRHRNLARLVTQVPLRHDIEKRCELSRAAVVAVYVVGDSDEVDAMLTEEHFRIKAGLQIITTDTAHVLYKNSGNPAGLNIRDQPLPVRAIKIAA